ncbi:MAG: DUF6864 domain-containing function [Neobacillus sp.]
MVKVSVGGLEVLKEGVVIVYKNKPVVFKFDDGDGELTVRWLFENDNEYADNYLLDDEWNQKEEEYILRFLNFDRASNVHSKDDIEVGTYRGKDLVLRYEITAVKGSKKVSYTWYLK